MASSSGETSLKMFLEKNPKMDLMKAARESHGGIWKLLDVCIFAFLIFMPALPQIPAMKEPAIIACLWVLIVILMWCKIEYANRTEVWFICLCRGVIVDFPKTNKPAKAFCQPPMHFAIVFILIFGIVTYIGLDPKFKFEKPDKDLVTAIFVMLGVLFVLLMTKSFVDMEGAPMLLTLNMVIAFFENPEFLKAQGFKVVHFANLQKFVNDKKAARDTTFSWDEVHALSSTPEDHTRISLIGGTKMWLFLKNHKDTGADASI